jgi:hypothetical protein
MSDLERLQRYLINSLELYRTGGSVFVRDNQTLILTDKDRFANNHYKLVETKFPTVCIDVVSSSSSHSGFLVLFTFPTPYNFAWERSVLRLGLHFLCFVYTLLWTLKQHDKNT